MDDLSVHDPHGAVGLGGNAIVMGDEDDGGAVLVHLLHQLQHLGAGLGVQGTGGLVGHQDGRAGSDGTGDGHPLLLTAGELAGTAVRLGGDLHSLQCLHGPLPPLSQGHLLVQHGQGHILPHTEGWDQVIALKDECDLPGADQLQLPAAAAADRCAVQVVLPGGGHIQAAQNIHHGGLAGAGGADDGHKLPLLNFQRHSVQGIDLVFLAFAVDFIDIVQSDQAHMLPP